MTRLRNAVGDFLGYAIAFAPFWVPLLLLIPLFLAGRDAR